MVDFFFLVKAFTLNWTFSCGLRDKLDISDPFLEGPGENFTSPKDHA